MAGLFTAREVCEQALRKINSFAINDDAADPTEMAVALKWLDLEMAELGGTKPLVWLVPDTVAVPLTGDKKDYDLDETLGAAAPVDGIQFPKHAALDLGTGNEEPIDIIGRLEYDMIARKDESGSPKKIFIDRLLDPTMTVWPVPALGVTGLSINLTFQTFTPEFSGNGRRATDMRPAWQKWAIHQVAAAIGSGPVRRLPTAEVGEYLAVAGASKTALLGFENSDHTDAPRRVAFTDF